MNSSLLWSNLIAYSLQIGLLVIPFWGSWRARNFENRRWADSDHPRGGGDDASLGHRRGT